MAQHISDKNNPRHAHRHVYSLPLDQQAASIDEVGVEM